MIRFSYTFGAILIGLLPKYDESLKSSYFPVVEIAVLSIIRLTLLALVACVPLLAQAAPYQLTTAAG